MRSRFLQVAPQGFCQRSHVPSLLQRLGFLLVLPVLMASCSRDRANVTGNQAVVPVLAAVVMQKTVPVEVTAIGNVEAYSTVAIKAMVGGELTQVHFKEGQDVQQGEKLFTIDPRPFEAALKQAEANFAKDGRCSNNQKPIWPETKPKPRMQRFRPAVTGTFTRKEWWLKNCLTSSTPRQMHWKPR